MEEQLILYLNGFLQNRLCGVRGQVRPAGRLGRGGLH